MAKFYNHVHIILSQLGGNAGELVVLTRGPAKGAQEANNSSEVHSFKAITVDEEMFRCQDCRLALSQVWNRRGLTFIEHQFCSCIKDELVSEE